MKQAAQPAAWRRAQGARLRRIAALAFLGAAGTSAAALPAGDRLLRSAGDEEQVQFSLTLPLRDPAQLDELLRQLYTPGSAGFHQFLSPDEFAARYGPTQAQYDDLKAQARLYGLIVTGEHPGRSLLNVQASAATIRKVFGTRMQVIQQADGREYFEPDREPVPPFPLSGAGVAALRQKPAHSHIVTRDLAAVPEQPHGGTSPGGTFGPSDLETAYDLDPIENGGTPVALFELSSATYSDVGMYTGHFHLGNPTLQQETVDGGTASTAGANEVILDIDAVIAVSKPSLIVLYTAPNTGNGALDAYQKIADDDLVHQVSTSWGQCEAQIGQSTIDAENSIFTQMAAEGMAVFAASGDVNAYDCGGLVPAVDDPGSQPYVTDVGGTSLDTTPAQAYLSESVWNNSSTSGSGGGISGVWSIPAYQQDVMFEGIGLGQYSHSRRNVPDVAADADPRNSGLYIYVSQDSGWISGGGTSAAAPQWAAFWSLVGKGLGRSPGFPNPTLYAIAENAGDYARDFHDVTSGNNNFYTAVKGYDDVTGWGSYNGANLYSAVIGAAGSGSAGSSSSSGGSGASASSGSSGSGSSGGGGFDPLALALLGLGAWRRGRGKKSLFITDVQSDKDDR